MRALVCFAVLTLAVPDRQDPNPKKEARPADGILGEWLFEKIVMGGGLGEKVNNEDRSIVFTPTDIKVKLKGQEAPEENTGYAIDWTKTPVTIDLFPKNGPQRKIEGILKLEGDQLIICFGIDKGRPAEFRVDRGGLVAMMHLKRMKR